MDTQELELRMQQILDGYLESGNGTFCFEDKLWKIGMVSEKQFRIYLRKQVKNGNLKVSTGEYDKVWYTRK